MTEFSHFLAGFFFLSHIFLICHNSVAEAEIHTLSSNIMCMISKGNSRIGNKKQTNKSGEGLLSWQNWRRFSEGWIFTSPPAIHHCWQHFCSCWWKHLLRYAVVRVYLWYLNITVLSWSSVVIKQVFELWKALNVCSQNFCSRIGPVMKTELWY